MSDHEMHVQAIPHEALEIWCSCGKMAQTFALGATTLALLNEIAHEHIEMAERHVAEFTGTLDEWAPPLVLRRASAGAEGYRPESVPFWPGQQFDLDMDGGDTPMGYSTGEPVIGHPGITHSPY